MLMCLCARFALDLVVLSTILSPAAQRISNATVTDAASQQAVRVELQHLQNPHGTRFSALAVQTLPSLTASGKLTTSSSWFPGFAWQYLSVNLPECAKHLGWRFTEETEGGAEATNLPPLFDLILFDELAPCSSEVNAFQMFGTEVLSSGPVVSITVQQNATSRRTE